MNPQARILLLLTALSCVVATFTTANAAVWPISGTSAAGADTISYPYGPRWIGRYDFHAGIDIPAAQGTPVRSVLAGTVVAVRTWDGESTGAGNNVLVQHAGGQYTAYLHLHTMNVALTTCSRRASNLARSARPAPARTTCT